MYQEYKGNNDTPERVTIATVLQFQGGMDKD